MATHDLTTTRPGLASGLLRGGLSLFDALRRRRRFARLRDLDDHMLDDIGVTRAEVETAARLPLSENAALELRRISLERRRSER